MITRLFTSHEIDTLYFELGFDLDDLPRNASKTTYAEFLIREMARRGQEQELVSILQARKPYVIWPTSYTYPFDKIDNSKNSGRTIRVTSGNYWENVEKVTVNFNSPVFPDNSSIPKTNYPRRKKRKSQKTINQVEKTEKEVFESEFARLKPMCWIIILVSLTVFVLYLVALSLYPKQILPISFAGIVICISISKFVYKKAFRRTLYQIDTNTGFYKLSVSDRMNVKSLLLSREWGDPISNLACRFVVSVFLETNKTRANKRSK